MKALLQHTLAVLVLCSSFAVQSQEFVWAPSLAVGDSIPLLEAPDQYGKTRTFADLRGKRGLVLFFNRSFDWCPYCKAQLKGLVSQTAAFEAQEFAIAAITYDAVQTLLEVTEDEGVKFPLLHDEAARHVLAYGILNTDYAPGHRAYGVPQPGILVIDPAGKILLKFAEQDYRNRPDFDLVLDALRNLP